MAPNSSTEMKHPATFFFRGSAWPALSFYGSGEPDEIRLKRPSRLIGPNRAKSPFKGLQRDENPLVKDHIGAGNCDALHSDPLGRVIKTSCSLRIFTGSDP